MTTIHTFFRLFLGASTCMFLLVASMYALAIPVALPDWRKILGFALFCAVAIVFEWTVDACDRKDRAPRKQAERKAHHDKET